MKKSFQKREIADIVLFSIFIPFICILYGSLELYFNNQNDFLFDIWAVVGSIVGAFLFCVGIGGVILYVLKRTCIKAYYLSVMIEFIAFICIYIQSNFLIGNLPKLDGTQPDWEIYKTENIISIIVVAAVVLLALAVTKIKGINIAVNIFKYVMSFISGVLLVTLVTIIISNSGTSRSLNYTITSKDIFKYSTDENLIILLLDTVDSEVFTEELQNNPEWSDNFKDFTYYPDTLGGYPATSRSIPLILSGQWHENEQDFNQYCEDVYENSELFEKLKQNSFDIGVYSTMVHGNESILEFENIVASSRVTSYFDLAGKFIRLSAFKFMPFGLKKYFYFDMTDFNDLVAGTKDYDSFKWDNLSFYDGLLSADVEKTKNKCFRFIHLEGAHHPYRYDADMNYVETGTTYEECVRGCMTLAEEYISLLKENDVYDNSAIVVMADHGQVSRYRETPLLLIKGIDEKNEKICVSDKALSYGDIATTFINLANGKTADQATIDRENRRFLNYEYMAEDYMEEYEQIGVAWNSDNLIKTGRVYTLDKKKAVDKNERGLFDLEGLEQVDASPDVDIWGMIIPEMNTQDDQFIRVYGWVYDYNLNQKPAAVYVEDRESLYKAEFIYLGEFASEDNDRAECGINVNIPCDAEEELTVYVVDSKNRLMKPMVIHKSDYITVENP